MITTKSYAGILIRDWCFHQTCLMMFDHQTSSNMFEVQSNVFEKGDTRSNLVVKHSLIIQSLTVCHRLYALGRIRW